jgi:hypothetical protein
MNLKRDCSTSHILQSRGAVACIESLVLDDEVRDWKGEAIEGGFGASLLEPTGVLVSECDDDQFIRREGPKRILARCRLRKLVGPLDRVGAGVVVGVCQPVEPGDVGGWRDDERLCILARVRTDRRAQSSRGHGGRGDDEQPTRHGFRLPGSSTAAHASMSHSVGHVCSAPGVSCAQTSSKLGSRQLCASRLWEMAVEERHSPTTAGDGTDEGTRRAVTAVDAVVEMVFPQCSLEPPD